MIRQFVISYDLLAGGQIYGALVHALKKQGANQLLLNAWALRTRWSKTQTLGWASTYLDEKDRLVVIEYRSLEAYRSIESSSTLV